MVRGKPYISVKSATRKAVNAPNDRQSRAVCGRVKLNAKMANTATLITTSDQSPYAGAAIIRALLPAGGRVRRDRRVLHRAPHERSARAGTRGAAGPAGCRAHAPGARS